MRMSRNYKMFNIMLGNLNFNNNLETIQIILILN